MLKKKRIGVFSFSGKLVESLVVYISKRLADFCWVSSKGTDLEIFLKSIEELSPHMILVSGLADFEKLKRIPERVFLNPELARGYLEEVAKSTKAVVSAIKEKAGKAKIIGFDGGELAGVYLESGADYFISGDSIDKDFLRRVFNLVVKEKIAPEDVNVVYEKKEFYNYVASKNFFEQRVKMTADKEKELKFLIEVLVKNKCRKILDAGCGKGRLAIPLAKAGFGVVGVDVSEVLLREAEEKAKELANKPRFVKANLLELRGESFDGVLMMWHVVCEFRSWIPELLRTMNRVLRKGGLLIFDFPRKTKGIKIDEKGYYTDEVNGFKKYVGLVPEIKGMLELLKYLGFKEIHYKKFKWGINKFVVVARKGGYF